MAHGVVMTIYAKLIGLVLAFILLIRTRTYTPKHILRSTPFIV